MVSVLISATNSSYIESSKCTGTIFCTIYTLYRIWIRFPLKSHVVSENNGNITDNGKQKILQSFQRRARIPTKYGNDTIINEIQTLDQEYSLKMTPRDYALVDEGKRFASKYFGHLTIFEDDVDGDFYGTGQYFVFFAPSLKMKIVHRICF